MGSKAPEFAPSDNPASDSDSLLTRTLTYNYLPFLNFWLLLFPKVLSFDWSMSAVPLLESVWDIRNLCTLAFYLLLGYSGVLLCRYLNRNNISESGPGNKHSKLRQHNTNGLSLHHLELTSLHGSCSPAEKFSLSGSARNRFLPRRRGSSSSESHSEDLDSSGSSAVSETHADTQHSLQVLTLSLAILVFPFIPATNLFFYVGFVVAERVLYIPSMGFCLLVAHGLFLCHQRCCGDSRWRRRVLSTAVVGLLVCYSARTVVRNQDWLTEENLYRAGITVNPAKG